MSRIIRPLPARPRQAPVRPRRVHRLHHVEPRRARLHEMPLARLAHVIGAVRRQARAGVVPGKVGYMRAHILPRDDRQRLVETLAQPLDPLRRRIEPREMRQQQPRIMAPPHAHQLATKPHRLLDPVERPRRQNLLDMRPRQHQRPLPPLRKSRVPAPQQISRSPAHPHAGTSRRHVALFGQPVEKTHLAAGVPGGVGCVTVKGVRRGRGGTRVIALVLPGVFRRARSHWRAPIFPRDTYIPSTGYPPPAKTRDRLICSQVASKVRHRPPRTRGIPQRDCSARRGERTIYLMCEVVGKRGVPTALYARSILPAFAV